MEFKACICGDKHLINLKETAQEKTRRVTSPWSNNSLQQKTSLNYGEEIQALNGELLFTAIIKILIGLSWCFLFIYFLVLDRFVLESAPFSNLDLFEIAMAEICKLLTEVRPSMVQCSVVVWCGRGRQLGGLLI